MKKINKKQKKNKINILLTCLASIFGFIFLFLPIISGISVSQNKKIYSKLFDNTTTSQQTKPGTVKYVTDDPSSNEPYLCKVDEYDQLMDDFKIMVATDLHMSEVYSNYNLQIEVLSKLIDLEKPDLVILDGDNIAHKNYTTSIASQQSFVKMFENKKQYWTFVLGNHDGQHLNDNRAESRKIAFDTLCGKNFDHSGEQSKYCLAKSQCNEGNGTHYLNIRGKSKKIIKSIFLFDCETINTKNDNVITWYRNSLQQIKNDNGGDMPESIAFSHIPFVEMGEAYKNINTDPNVEYISGENLESMCLCNEKNGLVEEFVNGGSTKCVIFGHDHINNISLKYKGIRMMYSSGLQFNAYNTRMDDRWLAWRNNFAHLYTNKWDCYMDGVTDIFLTDPNSEPVYGNVYCQNTNVFDGLKFQLAYKCGGWFTHPSQVLVWIHRINFVIVWGGVITCITFLIIRKKKNII